MWLWCILLAIKIGALSANNESQKFAVAFQWNFLNFTWESPEAAVSYVPGTDIIAGIKIYKGVIYLALPRVKSTSRVTLASIPLSAPSKNPLLSPFPSWEMNSGEACEALQDVLSMEIDREGIMWVLDARRVGKVTTCPPRIVLLDLNRNGAVVGNFLVPDELCPHAKGCFLNDIVLDGDFAYMSDTTRVDPGIFVYNRRLDRAWKVRDQTMHGYPEAEAFEAQGVVKQGVEHINGVALSPNCGGDRTFYFMPQSSFRIFSISTAVLKDHERATGNVSKYITDHGRKQGQSGGMICDETGDIYYGLLPLDAVGKWNTSQPLSEATILDQNTAIIKWPDSFSFNAEGSLYLITNSILFFSKNDIDIDNVNFRIIKLYTGTNSYIYCNKKFNKKRRRTS